MIASSHTCYIAALVPSISSSSIFHLTQLHSTGPVKDCKRECIMDVSEESLWKYPLYEYCENGNLWAVNRILSTPEGKAKMESEVNEVRCRYKMGHCIYMFLETGPCSSSFSLSPFPSCTSSIPFGSTLNQLVIKSTTSHSYALTMHVGGDSGRLNSNP